MSQKIIRLPFFKIENKSVYYLDKHRYLFLSDKNLGNKNLFDEGILIQKRVIKKGNGKKKKILVIEPHPDDFALSASGYVIEALSRGAEVKVLNIFSRMSIKKFPWREKITITQDEYEKLRFKESVISIENYLGEKFESLGMPSLSLENGSETFPKKYRQDNFIKDLAKILVKKISIEKFDTVLCPMAVRGHIDHSVTFDVIIKVFKSLSQKVDLVLYEDIPYARSKTAYFDRLKQIKKIADLKDLYIPTEKYLEIMADLIIIYRSQFDDINRQQMLAIIKEDFRAMASDCRIKNFEKMEFLQHYFIIKSLK